MDKIVLARVIGRMFMYNAVICAVSFVFRNFADLFDLIFLVSVMSLVWLGVAGFFATLNLFIEED